MRASLGDLAQRYRRYLLMVANESLSPALRAKVGASDLVQETLLHFQEKFQQFDGTSEEELLAWLRRILYFRAIQVARRYGGTQARDVRRELSLAELQLGSGTPPVVDEAPTPCTSLLAKEQVSRLEQAIIALPGDAQRTIQLRNVDRRSFAEMGQILGCTTDAARKRWVRALAQLPHDSMTPNDEFDGRRGDRPGDTGAGAADDVLDALLEQFDTAWTTGGMFLPSSLDQELPRELRGELDELKTCIALLNQAARQGALTVFDQATGVAGATPNHQADTADNGFVGEWIGRFEIVRELGRGGYGIVFLAHDAEMARDVALKLPRPEALVSPQLRRRFLREAQAAGRLDHPHVLPVFEAGEDGGLCYLISPFCRGPSLSKWLSEQQDAVDARGGRHGGIVGRRSRPGAPVGSLASRYQARQRTARRVGHGTNRVRRVAGSAAFLFRAQIGRFRPGQAIGSGRSRHAHRRHQLGTPSYMAPELAAGLTQEAGPAADIYALGAVLYELLVGKPPHQGASDADTLRLTATVEPAPPRRLRPKLSRNLEAVVLKCLEKTPADRYATAGDLAADLRRFLAGEPTRARPPGVGRPRGNGCSGVRPSRACWDWRECWPRRLPSAARGTRHDWRTSTQPFCTVSMSKICKKPPPPAGKTPCRCRLRYWQNTATEPRRRTCTTSNGIGSTPPCTTSTSSYRRGTKRLTPSPFPPMELSWSRVARTVSSGSGIPTQECSSRRCPVIRRA